MSNVVDKILSSPMGRNKSQKNLNDQSNSRNKDNVNNDLSYSPKQNQ
jgi:hypothetical protein